MNKYYPPQEEAMRRVGLSYHNPGFQESQVCSESIAALTDMLEQLKLVMPMAWIGLEYW
jgi:hypothetical protein